VISRRNRDFKKLFAQLPAEVQALAVKNYALWKADPWHPSLDFKNHAPSPDWSVRVGGRYRALGFMDGNTIVWHWIGTHEAYNKK